MLFEYKINIYCKNNSSYTNSQNINRFVIYIIYNQTNYIKRKLTSISFLFGIRFCFPRILNKDFRIKIFEYRFSSRFLNKIIRNKFRVFSGREKLLYQFFENNKTVIKLGGNCQEALCFKNKRFDILKPYL
jgi:hypothetical protein